MNRIENKLKTIMSQSPNKIIVQNDFYRFTYEMNLMDSGIEYRCYSKDLRTNKQKVVQDLLFKEVIEDIQALIERSNAKIKRVIY